MSSLEEENFKIGTNTSSQAKLTLFSPLAGGFLTGKFTQSTASDDLKSTRFEVSDGNPLGKAFRHWYDKDSMHQALEKLRKVCETYNVSMEEASLRWIVFHSALKAGDGVILGASKETQVHSNTVALNNGPLTGELASELDALWGVVETDAVSINP